MSDAFGKVRGRDPVFLEDGLDRRAKPLAKRGFRLSDRGFEKHLKPVAIFLGEPDLIETPGRAS